MNKSIFVLLAIVSTILPSCSNDDTLDNKLPTNGLILYYPFNGNATDESVNSNNGQIISAIPSKDRKGNENRAYLFNGVNDIIKFNYNENFNRLPITISFWVNFNELKSSVLSTDTVDNIQSGVWFSIGQSNSTKDRIAINYGNGGSPRSSSRKTFIADKQLTTNVWYHIVGIIEDFETLKIFINNNEIEGFESGEATSFTHSKGKGTIGRVWDPNSFFSGKMDDIRIYNRVLSNEEIEALYNE